MRKERETLEATLNEEKQKTAEEAFQQDLEEFMKDPKPRSMSSEPQFFLLLFKMTFFFSYIPVDRTSAASAKSMDEELKEALKNIEVAEKDEEEGLSQFLDSLDSLPGVESSDAKLGQTQQNNSVHQAPLCKRLNLLLPS